MTVDDYLGISESHGRWLGGLRWAEDGEAIEYAASDPEIGLTFAMTGEIALFLEGMIASGAFPHFSYVLQFFQLLGFGGKAGEGEVPGRAGAHAELASAFRETGRPLRNAGALFASLCTDLPHVASPPSPAHLHRCLHERSPMRFAILRRYPGEEPPDPPEVFDASVRRTLDRWNPDLLRHWLREGRGPIPDAREAVARIVPTSTAQILAALEARPRLNGLTALVAHLAGAISLPARRLVQPELPLGGYTDVATRGLPEQILPSQLALDPDEFIRRFASRELLYFHREEPHTPTPHELVLVVDQGVRTWGDVRLILAAATLALGRQAERQKVGFRIATTGTDGEPFDARGIGLDAVGEWLESTDLTPNPAAALCRVLESFEGSDLARDIVLLTHPRSLVEPEVADAARAPGPGTRLFAVAVDAAGEVALSELRNGAPVPLARCRVEIPDPSAQHKAPPPLAPPHLASAPAWKGDVESVGFPFRFGVVSPISDSLFTFDEDGEWLAVVGQLGIVHVWRVDGSESEILPRAVDKGIEGEAVLDRVEFVLGVAGGFVVIGRAGLRWLAAHYDLGTRTCRPHNLAPVVEGAKWTYMRRFHSIVAHVRSQAVMAIDLALSGRTAQYQSGQQTAPRAGEAFRFLFREPIESVIDPSGKTAPEHGRGINFQSLTGEVEIRAARNQWTRCIPHSEGKARLAGGEMITAHWEKETLALLIGQPDGRRTLHVYAVSPTWRALGEHVLPRDATDFALSRDGRRIAYRVGNRQVAAAEVGAVGPPTLLTPKGKVHPDLEVELGDGFFTVHTGRVSHLVRWDRGRLEMTRSEGDADSMVARAFGSLPPRVVAVGGPTPDSGLGDRRRFLRFAVGTKLTAAVDRFGQVVLLDRDRRPLCAFFFLREQVATWMPDGTRLGPASLIGGRPTPDGDHKIGSRLLAAVEMERSAST